MKAIETRYAGYRFRSRLEARWAVFFDNLGLPWAYEAEGFDLGDGLYYLPDFRVTYPGQRRPGDAARDVWFEVKAGLHLMEPQEWAKVRAFDAERTLIVLDGPPDLRMYNRANEAEAADAGSVFRSGLALWSSKGRVWSDEWEAFFGPPYRVVDDAAAAALARAVSAALSARF